MYETIRWKKVKTNVAHRCFSCERHFPARSEMVSWTGICDGTINSGYSCMICEEIMKIVEPNDEGGYDQGFVRNMDGGENPEKLLITIKKEKDGVF